MYKHMYTELNEQHLSFSLQLNSDTHETGSHTHETGSHTRNFKHETRETEEVTFIRF